MVRIVHWLTPGLTGEAWLDVLMLLGSNNEYSFEQAVVQLTKCRVETFDCTVKAPHLPPGLQGRVRFHPICVAGEDQSVDDPYPSSHPSHMREVEFDVCGAMRCS